MKTKAITLAILVGVWSAAISQSAEYDDVYFSKKDRQEVAMPMPILMKSLESPSDVPVIQPIIQAEGYSGRTINPDYEPGAVAVASSSYFTPNYQPTGVNSNLNRYASSNNNYPNSYGYSPYNSGWGNRGGYSSYGYGGWNSGMGYGSCYNSMGGFGSPYYGYGSGFNYGMGYGYGSGLGMMMGYGNGYGYGYGNYYPTTVVVVNNADNHVNQVYGKRDSRSSDYNNNMTGTRSGRSAVMSGNQQAGGRGGRVASSGTSNTYYQRGWRQDPAISNTSTTTCTRASSSNSTGGTRSTWSGSNGTNSRSNSAWDNGSSFGGSNSRGSSMNTGGGSSGGRSSGGFSGGGSSSGGGSRSSGGTRGRN